MENQKIMWHSEVDILNDLIYLDDFGVSGKDESYKILYSRGRGFKTQQKPKLSDSFIDSRTGETINVNDDSLEPNDICIKGKGRGSTLGSFLKSKYQLQKQLRLARPLGSSDNAIETFYRRHYFVERQESTSESESDAVKTEISVNDMHSTFDSFIDDNKRKRVKATRNSKLQHNVLINSLLSKGKCTSSLDTITEKKNGDGDGNDDDNDDDDDDDNDNEGSKDNSLVNSFCSSFDLTCKSVRSMGSDIETDSCDIQTKMSCMSVQGNDEEKLSFNVTKETNMSSKECKRQEVTDSFDEAEHLYGSTSDHFTINVRDFPPLKRNNLT